jgi:hypothetical protein
VAEPSEEKRAIGRLLVELGADAVLGSSAHVLQGIEVHQGRPIVHDAGNLLFDSLEGARDAAVMVLDMDANGVYRLRVEPVISDYGSTRQAGDAEHERILADLQVKSEVLGTTLVDGTLELAPPSRPAPVDLAQAAPRETAVTLPAREPPPGCLVDAVPADLQVDPVEVGPLTLIGAGVDPTPVDPDTLAWVESYWQVEEAVADNLWLSPRLEPSGGGETWRGDHEPCDWGWPISRMVPGQIYLDRAPLAPRSDAGDELALRVGVTDGDETLGTSDVLLRVPVAGE